MTKNKGGCIATRGVVWDQLLLVLLETHDLTRSMSADASDSRD